jgi:uncharacterized protein YukE
MDERFDFEHVEQIHESFKVMREPIREPMNELRESISEPISEFDNQPKSAKELAEYFGVTDRAIQNWFKFIADAYCWLSESDLKAGDGKNTRYRPFTISAMQALRVARESGQTANDWIAEIQKLAPQPEIQQPQEVEAPQTGQLITTEVVEEELPVSEIARIRQDRYHVPNTGSNRLAKAQQTHQMQRSNLQNTRERVQQAFFGLAVQTHENFQAEQLENEAGKEQTFEEAYADELEKIQIENAAREAARADYAAFQEQVRMGNVPAPTASSASI